MLTAIQRAMLGGPRPRGLSPYTAMDHLWDGAGIVNTGAYATSWTPAIGGALLSEVQANGCGYVANWRNGHAAIVSTTGRLQNSGSPSVGGSARCYILAGQFPTAVANGTYKGISVFSGKAFPFILAGTPTTVQLESWEETLDHGIYSFDIKQWLGEPFFAVVRHEAGAYRMVVRVGGTTYELPQLSGPSPAPSGSNGWTMGGTADTNNEWDAPLSMGGIRASTLTDAEMVALCDWSIDGFDLPDAISPYTLSPDVALWYSDPAIDVSSGYFPSVPNTLGALGGAAVPPVLDTNTAPENNSAAFNGSAAFFRASFGGAAGQRLIMNVTHAFKRLHTATGGTMLMRVRTTSPLFNGAYGIFFSDMTGVPGNTGIHLKAGLDGSVGVSLGNGVTVSDVFTAAGAIAPNRYYTFGYRTRPGTVDPSKIKAEGFINGIKVVESAELAPDNGNATAAEVIGSYVAAVSQGQNMIEHYRFVLPILTDAEMRGAHDWFISNP